VNSLESLIEQSFLRRVPDLIIAGATYEEAVTEALRQETDLQMLLIETAHTVRDRDYLLTEREQIAALRIEQMMQRVYRAARR
jgi:hypothetical protein